MFYFALPLLVYDWNKRFDWHRPILVAIKMLFKWVQRAKTGFSRDEIKVMSFREYWDAGWCILENCTVEMNAINICIQEKMLGRKS